MKAFFLVFLSCISMLLNDIKKSCIIFTDNSQQKKEINYNYNFSHISFNLLKSSIEI